MENKIIFYHNPMSRGRIVQWMLEEVGASYETKVLDFKKQEHKTPEYLKINPMGKIPAIVFNGTVITESAAICAFLADAYPEARLAPELKDPKRGTYLRWLFFSASCIEPAMHDKKFPRVEPIPSGHLGYGSYDATMNALELAIKDGWILGDMFSAADVYLASVLGYGMMMGSIDKRPSFEAYVKRAQDRPAYQKVK